MSRNKFEIILSMFHCGNDDINMHGRLNKIQSLIDMLVTNFNK
jgi:hypothetical protein